MMLESPSLYGRQAKPGDQLCCPGDRVWGVSTVGAFNKGVSPIRISIGHERQSLI